MEHLAGFPPLLRNFFGHVRAVDANVGKLIDLLRETDALDNTIIVFTSDNGAAASRENTLPANAPSRGHKGQYVSGGMRVPLLIYWPAGLKKTGTTDTLVSLLDTMPTFLDAADPGEKNNLAESNPETVKEMRAVMAAHAQDLPPPNRWNRKKWTELMESLPTP